MRKQLLTLLAVILLISTVLAGCGNKKEEASSSKSEKAEDVNQELTTNLGGEPYTLDPALASDTTSFWVIEHLYEGLYTRDKDGKVVEGAASKIEVSDDGKTYTFTIRDDAKWSNGDPLTAKDFEYSWKRVLNPETAAYDPSTFYYIKGAEAYNTGKGSVEDVGISTTDDQTLVVELNSPLSYFPKIVLEHAYLPVNKNVVEGNKDWAAESDGIVTNGAYTVSSWKHNEELILQKSDSFWNAEKITLNKINFKMIEDTTTAYQMYKSGELDFIRNLPLDSLEQEKSSKEYVNFPSFSVYTFSFNVNENSVSNSKIRKAFSYAIDREAITENITKGGEAPAYGYVPFGAEAPSGSDFREEAPKYYSFDPKEAKKLLAEGLKEEGWKELPEVTIKYNTADNHKKIAEAVQEMIKENLGVEIKLENQEWKTYIDTFKQKNFQIARMGWGGNFLDPVGSLDLYTSKNSGNFTNWSSKKYDELISQSVIEQDAEKRFKILHEAESVLLEEMPIIPVLFSAQNVLISEKVEGIRLDALADPDLRFAKRVAE
ncbi:peptide ABC transporter substrate-binding protein [Cytobacillus praedii]|uniref:peptide ABC transporter substrate-binding protein n=1 Tax=Cytobacillus praedii TaxID=1742358 RepID=UPI002E1C54F3|nr:peptide ABC transporter substrate-binding protein [Cytobacillus praedii]